MLDERSPPPAKRRRTHRDVDADDDVVFEVLRFMYCGTVYIFRGFYRKFDQFLAAADQLGVQSIEQDPGVEHLLCTLPLQELLEPFRKACPPWAFGEQGARALLARLAARRPRDFSAQALDAFGVDFAWLLGVVHPGLTHLRVVNMSGGTVLDNKLDWTTTVASVKARLCRAAGGPKEATPSLVLGAGLLADEATLRDAGAAGVGCSMSLGVVWEGSPVGKCLCGQPELRFLTRKAGPSHMRALMMCNGFMGVQCRLLERAGAGL